MKTVTRGEKRGLPEFFAIILFSVSAHSIVCLRNTFTRNGTIQSGKPEQRNGR